MAKFVPETAGQKPGAAAASIARSLGIVQDGVLAVYFADIDSWSLWIGDSRIDRFKGSSLHDAKKALLTAAEAQAEIYTAEAKKAATPDKPVTSAQIIKYKVDAVIDALIQKLEPDKGG